MYILWLWTRHLEHNLVPRRKNMYVWFCGEDFNYIKTHLMPFISTIDIQCICSLLVPLCFSQARTHTSKHHLQQRVIKFCWEKAPLFEEQLLLPNKQIQKHSFLVKTTIFKAHNEKVVVVEWAAATMHTAKTIIGSQATDEWVNISTDEPELTRCCT